MVAAQAELGDRQQRLLVPPQLAGAVRELGARAGAEADAAGAAAEVLDAEAERRDRHRLVGLAGEDLELGGAVGVEGAVAVQVVLGEVEQDGGLGRERQRVLELERATPRATTVVAGASVPGSEVSAVPTLPATFTGSPASRCRWPISSTVVVLPLEPVTAMNSCSPSSRQPVSYSPSTGIPRSRAAATTGASFGTPGLLIDAAGALEQLHAAARAHATCTPAARRRSATSSATGPESTPATTPPRSRSASAAATPERARPTTRYGPGGSGGRGITGPIQAGRTTAGAPAPAAAGSAAPAANRRRRSRRTAAPGTGRRA